MNTQPIENFNPNPNILEIINIYLTIQGEGPFSGHRAVFIRLAGCNLQCPNCYINYTSNRRHVSIRNIKDQIFKLAPNSYPLIVITGGEPFRQNISKLCAILSMAGYSIEIETNGTLPPPVLTKNVTLVCSPKTARINAKIRRRTNAFKYVLAGPIALKDGLPLQVLGNKFKTVARPPPGTKVYVTPASCQDETINYTNKEIAFKSCIQHGHILQMQLDTFSR